jgi:hypothetical protein
MGLVAGERVPMEMLVYGLMIRSGNDAATAVAEHLAGSVEGFVELMNERAAELGSVDVVRQPARSGCPRPLLVAARSPGPGSGPRCDPGTRRDRHDHPLSHHRRTGRHPRIAESTNALLDSYEGTFGVKTGFTFGAGLVFVGGAEREGRTLWVVVMGSEGSRAHFADCGASARPRIRALRIVDTIGRGIPFRLVSGPVDPQLMALARLTPWSCSEVLAAPADVAEPVEVETRTETLTADLPGPGDAFRWLMEA